jgi:hypothetical protein
MIVSIFPTPKKKSKLAARESIRIVMRLVCNPHLAALNGPPPKGNWLIWSCSVNGRIVLITGNHGLVEIIYTNSHPCVLFFLLALLVAFWGVNLMIFSFDAWGIRWPVKATSWSLFSWGGGPSTDYIFQCLLVCVLCG